MMCTVILIITIQIGKNILIVFDDMIADILTNKKIQAIIKELFIRCRKLNISLVFITQSYFAVSTKVRLNSTHYLIMTIHDKRELQQIAINHSANIDYKDFLKIYRNCTKEPYYFLTVDTNLPASNSLRFRKKSIEFFVTMTLTDELKILDDKVFKKGDNNKKVSKYDNNLVYDSVHNCNKYNVPSFNEISSIDPKFNTINKCYEDLLKLNAVKSQSENKRQIKISVLKNALLL